MYMERIETSTVVDAQPSKSNRHFLVGVAVVTLLMPYLVVRIGLSGLNMLVHSVAAGLAAVGEITLREIRRLP